MLNSLWSLKNIQNLRQNRSKNKLVRENAVTQAQGSCSLLAMGSCYCTHDVPESHVIGFSVCIRSLFAQKCKVSNGFLYSVHMQ